MRSFITFFKKEVTESIRRKRIMIIGIVFFAFGLMNPALTWLTPVLYDLLSDSLAEAGMIIGSFTVDALVSWAEFFSNMAMAMIAFFCIFSGIFTKEYSSGTIILVLTKGLERYKVVLAKAAIMFLTWTGAYWLCFGTTFVLNEVLWDNSVTVNLALAGVNWWIFGIFAICLIVLFSVLTSSYVGVLFGAGGTVVGIGVLSIIPFVGRYLPTALTDGVSLILGAQSAGYYLPSILITLALCVGCIALSIPLFNKKQL